MMWVRTGWGKALELLIDHVLLAVPAIVLIAVISVPVGYLASRHRRMGNLILVCTSVLYAVPSLPMLIILPALLGVSLRSTLSMVSALTLYGIAIFVRTAADAFSAVSTSVKDTSLAIGYSLRERFWYVELPLAIPLLVAGLRVVAVSTVGLVTIGALVGVSSLGTLFTDGFQRGIFAEVMAGLLLTVLLALALDRLIVMVGRKLTPWTRVSEVSSASASVHRKAGAQI